MLDALRRAHAGGYGVVLSLLGVLSDGAGAKRRADGAIDACDHVANLRESVLQGRVAYSLARSVSAEDDRRREEGLDRAVRGLEK
jgi:hypothetical protein